MTHDEKIVEAVARALQAEGMKREGSSKLTLGTVIASDLARAAITAFQAEAWQDISTAPKDGDEIDLWAGGERLTNCWWGRATYGGRERTWVRHSYDDSNGPVFNEIRNPTHWQPLPPAPKATP